LLHRHRFQLCPQALLKFQDVDVSALRIETDDLAVGHNPCSARLVHQRAQLTEAPPQRPARVIRYFPEHGAKPIPAVRPACYCQIGKQGARLLGARQIALHAFHDNPHLS
jgi:hypothetical protein